MTKKIGYLMLAGVMALAPISPASAYDHGHHHGGRNFGLFALGAAAIVGTVAILTAPVRALADAGPGPGYYQQPAYAPPPPQPSYYYPQQQAYYAPPPPVYYAPQPVYYAPRYYYGR